MRRRIASHVILATYAPKHAPAYPTLRGIAGHLLRTSINSLVGQHDSPVNATLLTVPLAMAQRVLLRPTGFALALRTPRSCRKFSTVLDTPVYPVSERNTNSATQSTVFNDALNATAPRTTWTKEEISEVYHTSLIDLTYASVC